MGSYWHRAPFADPVRPEPDLTDEELNQLVGIPDRVAILRDPGPILRRLVVEVRRRRKHDLYCDFRHPFRDPPQPTGDARPIQPKETPMKDQPHRPQHADKRPDAPRAETTPHQETARPQAASNKQKAANPMVGDTVHYTEMEPRPDLIDKDEQFRRQHAGAAPLQRIAPRVLPAMVIAIDDEETGAVCLRVFHRSSANDEIVPNCRPADAGAGSLQARGAWTPRDRPLYDWDAEEREQALTQQRPPTGVDPERGR